MSVNKPATREEFRELCLRKLGSPVIKINVDPEQIEDAIEEALKYYIDYHYDGTELTYLKHQLTADDVATKTIDIPEQIVGVQSIFSMGGSSMSSSNMFSFEYQFSLSLLPDLASFTLAPYYIAQMQLNQIRELLIGNAPIRFNRHKNKLHLDMSSFRLSEGNFIVIECYTALDPEVDTDIWNDRWLQKYTSALIKKVWGMHLSKYDGIQLPGNVTLQGTKIYDDAVAELSDLEDAMRTDFSLPPLDLIM
jgi:hypothetical protein